MGEAPGEDGAKGADDVFFVSMRYKGQAYRVPVQAEDPIATIFDFAQEALDFPRENCKLLHRGKQLRPDHDDITVAEAKLKEGSEMMLIAVSAHDVSFVQSSRADPLVKGFAEEERDEKSRRKRARAAEASAWGTKQDAEFRFGSIKAEFKYSEPPPFEAEKLLQKLSTDPGIIDIMKSRHFKVGILTEMSPVEAQERMAKRGTPDMDLLGYNQNAGDMIVLRLRTDSLKGFRPYHDLINTLIHELTHNVWGPHDHNFWKLYGELKAQYMRFHRFWSHGGHAADSGASGQFQGFIDNDDESGGAAGSSGFGQVLGGAQEAPARTAGAAAEARRRAAAAEAAAEARIREASAAAAAAAAAEAAAAPAANGLPNFLAGDGTWTFVCPCGQVHDFSGMCEEGAAAASADAGKAPGGEAKAPEGESPAEPMDVVPQAEEPPALAPEPCQPAEEVAALDLLEDRAPEPSSSSSAAPAAAPDPPAQAAETQEPKEGPGPGPAPDFGPMLDEDELAALGLDGSALWLRRFQEKLQLLRDQGRIGEAAAVLLRLVSNILQNPGEQKFRLVKEENKSLRAKLLSAGLPAEDLLSLLGFEVSGSAGQRLFQLREPLFDPARLRMGQELLERELGL